MHNAECRVRAMTNRRSFLQGLAMTALFAAAAFPARAEVIDRVLAVVGSQIITLSDARAAVAFGLVDPPASGDQVYGVMQRLIDRTLMLIEVQRYLPEEPALAEIDKHYAAIRGRFPTAADFEKALATTGLGPTHLREMARDDLRIQAYIQDRFSASVQPTDEEVLAYARAHRAELEALASTPDEQLSIASNRLTAERRQLRVADWLNGLRRRADVTELYLPRPSSSVRLMR
jgi:hypothetical protein